MSDNVNHPRSCPCGGIILADTENWKTPLCYHCYTDLHEGYSNLEEKLIIAVDALAGLRYGSPQCFCDCSIGNPRMSSHSQSCVKASEILAQFRGEDKE